ncbi:TetR/AcrR family transcriptional regulator [Branchiibius cervicis]|uniref:TetR/AcrR family transcriptional regulator n=1 Tax=Branchiibius cervicis TaxID=908252 RepID=A0ABW2AU12_9MICO
MRTERRAQILAATAQCVATFGLAGLTLEKVSAESGMSRGHIRHYIGNRDDLILALVEWELGRDEIAAGGQLTDSSNIAAMLDYLFGPTFSEPGDENTVVLELLNAARTNDGIREAMLDGYNGLRQQINSVLSDTFPAADAELLSGRSYALLCLAIGNAALSDLDRSTASDPIVRAAAERIILEFEKPQSAPPRRAGAKR